MVMIACWVAWTESIDAAEKKRVSISSKLKHFISQTTIAADGDLNASEHARIDMHTGSDPDGPLQERRREI